jgi:hypothetical protein
LIIDKTYLIILKQQTKMRKILTYAVSALALASCSSDSLVSDSPANTQAPIAFNAGQKNITRAVDDSKNLEKNGHYNFGVWAYKYKTADATTGDVVMDHYLVGYSNGTDKGYDKSNVSTWADNAGTLKDHTSSWFYEKLGKAEYNTDYMSVNANQYLRYWDLSYNNTKFFAYAPYCNKKNSETNVNYVTFAGEKITVAKDANKAGYDNPAVNDFIYAGAQATNADQNDVKLAFKHLGAIVKVAFRESVPGYKVQLIDVTTDGSGIQATTAKKNGDSYIHSTGTTDVTYVTYLKSCGATIDYSSSITAPSVSVVASDVETSHENLKFDIPKKTTEGLNGLVDYQKDENSPKYVVLPEKDGDYAKSPTTYYAVVQPSDSETGFTFHISYNLIAEDNGEVVTVRDARVFVPADQVRWASNTAYTYNFTISKVSTGTTNPNDPNINLDDPTVSAGTVVPIVFDGATIEDYTPNAPNNGNIPY